MTARSWLASIGTVICWLSAPFIAMAVLGAVLMIDYPGVALRDVAFGVLIFGGLWLMFALGLIVAHRGASRWVHIAGCALGILAGLGWIAWSTFGSPNA